MVGIVVSCFRFVFVSLEKGNTGIAMPLFSFAAILAFAIGVPTARKGYYSVPLGIAAAPSYLYTRFILHWHVSL
jgi:hypothetical protein